MTRAILVLGGLVMVATQKTPFDLTGVHVGSQLTELTLCAVVMIGVLSSGQK